MLGQGGGPSSLFLEEEEAEPGPAKGEVSGSLPIVPKGSYTGRGLEG